MKLWDLMESPVKGVRELRRRTLALALIHVVLAAGSVALLTVLALHLKALVTLTQRGNVETLVLGFFAAFVAVLLVTTGPATVGAAALLALRLVPSGRRHRLIQSRLVEDNRGERVLVLLNLRVVGPEGPLELPLEDGYGRLGLLRVSGVEMVFEGGPRAVAGPLFELAAAVLADQVEVDPDGNPLRLILWADVDRSEAEVYRSQVRAFERLGRGLQAEPAWPTARLGAEGLERLRSVLAEATPHLRENVLMPDIAYAAEFTIPLVPEPLAFVQIRRHESRADPVASLGCATLMVLMALAIVAWAVVSPPWVPPR